MLPTRLRIFSTPCFKINFAGGSPAATYFLLGGQEKVSKEKAALVRRPLRGFPALLNESGGCGTRPCRCAARTQTVLADPSRRVCVTRRLTRGSSPVLTNMVLPNSGCTPFGFGSPLRAAEQHSPVGGSRRALSEPSQFHREGELRSRPTGRAAQGSPKDRRTRGRFFWLLFLAVQEK